MQNKKTGALSDNTTRPAPYVWFLTPFALLWNLVTVLLLLPKDDVPWWFKSVFVLAGAVVGYAVATGWIGRIKGGAASLKLAQDPLPHGLATPIEIVLSKPRASTAGRIAVTVSRSQPGDRGLAELWHGEFAVHSADGRAWRGTICIPEELPSTQAADRQTQPVVTLNLQLEGIEWVFNLATRPVRPDERVFAAGAPGASPLPSSRPQNTMTPARAAQLRKRWLWGASGFAALVFATQLYGMLDSFFDFQLLSRAKAATGVGGYTTSVQTPDFPFAIHGWENNSWGVQAKLLGSARIADGVLQIEASDIAVRHHVQCREPAQCTYTAVSVLLARDGEKNFSTVAESNLVATDGRFLQRREEWHAGPQSLQLALPPALEQRGVWLKLQVHYANGGSAYIDGPRLQLQRALAAQLGRPDPCLDIGERLEALRAGCSAQLAPLLQQPLALTDRARLLWHDAKSSWLHLLGHEGAAAGEPPAASADGLLITALKTEFYDAVPILLEAGANPNARDPDNPARTAVLLAARANALTTLDQLLGAGGQADLSLSNDLGQEVTPLSGALRSDSAEAVSRLLQAGAKVHSAHASGWTPMHIAAYDGAARSLPLLVHAGADVDERATAHRQQTPLMTAIQHSDLATVRALLAMGARLDATDNQGQTPCGWAQFFKRPDEMRAAVCSGR